ncbi:MAG: B12-binding domain-containing radical SAM protein, partial [Prevotella sp.]|nr:B12-binding domain-containing radical SAM protein [Prevotella sp.]
DYCEVHHPDMLRDVTKAWIEAGLSLRKEPASAVLTKHITPCDDWMILRGEYKPSLRLCFLPAEKSEDRGIWYGYETERLERRPVFVAEKK